jgi:hypothetical protein
LTAVFALSEVCDGCAGKLKARASPATKAAAITSVEIRIRAVAVFAKEVSEHQETETDIGVGRTIDDDEVIGLPVFEDIATRGNYGDFSGSNAASGNIYESAEVNNFEDDGGQI